MRHVTLDDEKARKLELEARQLAEDLRGRVIAVKNGIHPMQSGQKIEFLGTKFGRFGFMEVHTPKKMGLGSLAMWGKDHYLLTGVVDPNGGADAWFYLPIILKRVAILLGAVESELIEHRQGNVVESTKGAVRAESDAKVQAGHALVAPVGVTDGGRRETQTITLRWPAAVGGTP